MDLSREWGRQDHEEPEGRSRYGYSELRPIKHTGDQAANRVRSTCRFTRAFSMLFKDTNLTIAELYTTSVPPKSPSHTKLPILWDLLVLIEEVSKPFDTPRVNTDLSCSSSSG